MKASPTRFGKPPADTLSVMGERLAEAWAAFGAAEAAGDERTADGLVRTIARLEIAIGRGTPRTLEEVLLVCRLALSRLADEEGATESAAMLIRVNGALEALLGIARQRFAGERYVPRS